MPPPSRAANPTTKNKSSQGALSPCLVIAVRLAVAAWFCRGLGSVPARPSVRRRSRENDHLAGRRFLSGISASSRGKRRLLGRRCSRRGAVHVTPRLLHTDARFIQSRSCVSSGAGLLQSERSHRVRCSGADDDGTASAANALRSGSDLPAKFDLRERGVVTPVKLQNPWGSCWGFASIAASETSILSELGTTYDQMPLDLSERHLAWFASPRVPKTSSIRRRARASSPRTTRAATA